MQEYDVDEGRSMCFVAITHSFFPLCCSCWPPGCCRMLGSEAEHVSKCEPHLCVHSFFIFWQLGLRDGSGHLLSRLCCGPCQEVVEKGVVLSLSSEQRPPSASLAALVAEYAAWLSKTWLTRPR